MRSRKECAQSSKVVYTGSSTTRERSIRRPPEKTYDDVVVNPEITQITAAKEGVNASFTVLAVSSGCTSGVAARRCTLLSTSRVRMRWTPQVLRANSRGGELRRRRRLPGSADGFSVNASEGLSWGRGGRLAENSSTVFEVFCSTRP